MLEHIVVSTVYCIFIHSVFLYVLYFISSFLKEMILKMHDLGFLWSTDLVKWTLLIVVQLRMASNVDLLSPEIIVPGTGHVEKLPHNLRPSLQETHSMMFDHRFPPRTGHRGHLSNKMRRHVILPSVLKKGSVIKRTSSTTSQRQVNVQPLVVNSRYQNKSTFMGSFIINSQFANSSSLETHSIISDVGQKVQSSVVHRSMASSNWKSRRSIIGTLHLLEDSGQVKGPRRERRNDESQTVTPSSANYNHSDSPLLPNDRSGNEPRGWCFMITI